MRSSAAARRYARALFSIARDASAIDAIGRDLERMAALLDQNAELHHALFRPLHPVKERRAVLQRLCERLSLAPSVRSFFGFLVDQRRLVDFDAIRREFVRLADEAAGRMQAEVVTASELPAAQRERLTRALASRTGRQIELVVKVDPELIGGAIAKVGGVVFDGSLRTQLSQLHDSLTKG